MAFKIILTGDVNLMNVDDPAVPFAKVAAEFRSADVVVSNLYCLLCVPPQGHSVEGIEVFFTFPGPAGEALKHAGIQAVGIGNNVNYGEAAIKASIARLDELGLPHTGAGANEEAARTAVVLERGGTPRGILQRHSVDCPTKHEAKGNFAGVAVIRGNTAYQLPLHKTRPEIPPANRPGVPPEIITWADPKYLAQYLDELSALRKQ